MESPMMGYRAGQLDLCLKHRDHFLSYYLTGNDLSLPERMKECDFINTLHLIGNEYTTLEDISLIEDLPNIKKLSFWGIKTIKEFKSLTTLSKLKSLSIEMSLIDLDIIKQLPLLDELHLDNFSQPTISIDCEKIAKQTNLRNLSLKCAEYFNEEHLTDLSNLTSLSLRQNLPLPNSKTLKFLKQFPSLQHLAIEVLIYSGYSDASTILELDRLQSLTVKGYDGREEFEYQGHDWLTVDFINKLRGKITLEECWLSGKNKQ